VPDKAQPGGTATHLPDQVESELICSVGAVSDKGIRSENQDQMSRVETPVGELLMVADGVGGNIGGARAAALTITTIEDALQAASADAEPQKALREAIEQANRAVYEPAHSGNPHYENMASTIVAVLVHNRTAHIAHAGDSRIYLVRGDLRRLTHDHSRIQQMIDSGQLTAEQARNHPDSSTITRAIGDKPEVQVEDGQPLFLENGDGLLLCTDGLHGYVEEKDILAAIRNAPSPQAAAEALVALASESGSRDNITVQYARFAAPRSAVGTSGQSSVQGENRKDEKNQDVSAAVRWRPTIAAAVIMGFAGYLGYPMLHPVDSLSLLTSQFNNASARVASLQTEYDRAQTAADAAQKAAKNLQSATPDLAAAQQRQSTARAALQKAQHDEGTAQGALKDLQTQTDAAANLIATLSAKETRTADEQQQLAAAGNQKGKLEPLIKSAQQTATAAGRQLAAAQVELDRANAGLKPVGAGVSNGQTGAGDTQEQQANTRLSEALKAAKVAAANLEDAQRQRDAFAEQIRRAGSVVPVAPTVVNPPPAKAPPVKLLILAPTAADSAAAGLQTYFRAHPVVGVDVQVAPGATLSVGGNSGGSAVLFDGGGPPDGEKAQAVQAVKAQIEAALKSLKMSGSKSAPKVSVVIVLN
jgi:serine/threonine protein phosphatase PrpC